MLSDEEYEVEKILDEKEENGALKYLVKWLNHDETWNTWEPEMNFHSETDEAEVCEALLQWKNKKKSKPSKPRGRPRMKLLVNACV